MVTATGRQCAGGFFIREVAWQVCFRFVSGFLWVLVAPVFRLVFFSVGSKKPVNFYAGFLVLVLIFRYAFVLHLACGALQTLGF